MTFQIFFSFFPFYFSFWIGSSFTCFKKQNILAIGRYILRSLSFTPSLFSLFLSPHIGNHFYFYYFIQILADLTIYFYFSFCYTKVRYYIQCSASFSIYLHSLKNSVSTQSFLNFFNRCTVFFFPNYKSNVCSLKKKFNQYKHI